MRTAEDLSPADAGIRGQRLTGILLDVELLHLDVGASAAEQLAPDFGGGGQRGIAERQALRDGLRQP